MTSKAEMFGAALGKAIKKTAEKMKEETPAAAWVSITTT